MKKIVVAAAAILLAQAFVAAVVFTPGQPSLALVRSTTATWPAGTNGWSALTDFSSLIPAHDPEPYLFAPAASGSNFYWVGSQASDPTTLPNTGVQTSIQVLSQQVTGCLSFWASEQAASTLWGQVGYYICNGSTPVAFYQIWKSGSVLVTGTASVTTGYHQFSMYFQSGTTWAYSLDGKVFGTYGMGANVSSSTYPVQALSEEGYVSAPWNPTQTQFSTAMEVMKSGAWYSVQAAFSPYSCGSSTLSCWGVQGNAQNPSLTPDSIVIGGTVSPVVGGTLLWNGATSTTSTTTSTSSSSSVTSSSSITSTTSTSTSSSSTVSTSTSSSSTSSSSLSGVLGVTLTALPTTNTRKSVESFTVLVTDQNGNLVGGASVTLTINAPNGKSYTTTGTTDINGLAYFQYRLSAVAPKGVYTVSALASYPGFVSGAATGSFTVS